MVCLDTETIHRCIHSCKEFVGDKFAETLSIFLFYLRNDGLRYCSCIQLYLSLSLSLHSSFTLLELSVPVTQGCRDYKERDRENARAEIIDVYSESSYLEDLFSCNPLDNTKRSTL